MFISPSQFSHSAPHDSELLLARSHIVSVRRQAQAVSAIVGRASPNHACRELAAEQEALSIMSGTALYLLCNTPF